MVGACRRGRAAMALDVFVEGNRVHSASLREHTKTQNGGSTASTAHDALLLFLNALLRQHIVRPRDHL